MVKSFKEDFNGLDSSKIIYKFFDRETDQEIFYEEKEMPIEFDAPKINNGRQISSEDIEKSNAVEALHEQFRKMLKEEYGLEPKTDEKIYDYDLTVISGEGQSLTSQFKIKACNENNFYDALCAFIHDWEED